MVAIWKFESTRNLPFVLIAGLGHHFPGLNIKLSIGKQVCMRMLRSGQIVLSAVAPTCILAQNAEHGNALTVVIHGSRENANTVCCGFAMSAKPI